LISHLSCESTTLCGSGVHAKLEGLGPAPGTWSLVLASGFAGGSWGVAFEQDHYLVFDQPSYLILFLNKGNVLLRNRNNVLAEH